ncbi:MAG TPA: leucyl aminopeptidase [Rugosimonospora sp.]|nr:leucyl aminopeptidase [Rugosimonospora sp.]
MLVSGVDGDGGRAGVPELPVPLSEEFRAELAAYLDATEHSGAAGSTQVLVRPGRRTRRVLLTGVGAGDEASFRTAGAAVTRAALRERGVTVALPAGTGPGELRGFVEGLLLAAYRYRLAPEKQPGARALRQVTVTVDDPAALEPALARALAVAESTYLARDLTNAPSAEKSPAWFADRVARAAADTSGVRLTVREPADLRAEGFGGILAVGGGSARGPRLVELSWRPRGARRHVVLVGKGITFDSGGISIKTVEGMKLMRKDMGGAAAVIGATLGAARLRLPVRVTALAPLAENMPSGSAWRPGDVVRHYGGRTTEVLNTDAEGRVVLADALAYAARRLNPDVLVDLATLTAANLVALGKRTAALYTDSEELAGQLRAAATAAGENVWRMPLPDDYLELFASEMADVANIPRPGSPGSVAAALYLREFTGTARGRWAHLDMSAPSWTDSTDGELVKGATGWGVRTLVRWLERLAADGTPRPEPGAATA